MAITYTENLHLGMQLDKTDYFSMDNINENWQKIDSAVSGGGNVPNAAILLANGATVMPPESLDLSEQ